MRVADAAHQDDKRSSTLDVHRVAEIRSSRDKPSPDHRQGRAGARDIRSRAVQQHYAPAWQTSR